MDLFTRACTKRERERERAVAKGWGLPLSFLPNIHNFFHCRPEIGACHACMHKNMYTHVYTRTQKPLQSPKHVPLIRQKWASPGVDGRQLISCDVLSYSNEVCFNVRCLHLTAGVTACHLSIYLSIYQQTMYLSPLQFFNKLYYAKWL